MKGNDDVLALLAELLVNELTAVNQYLLQAETCGHWGYRRLAAKLREESDGERQHAAMLIDRMLFLEGAPDLGRYHPLRGGRSVHEFLEADLELERIAVAALEAGIAKCRAAGDNASEDLLTEILTAEQDDMHWLEMQLEQLRQLGEQNYLAQQLEP